MSLLNEYRIGIEEDDKSSMFWNTNVDEDLAEMTQEQIDFLLLAFGVPSAFERDGVYVIGFTYNKEKKRGPKVLDQGIASSGTAGGDDTGIQEKPG